MGAWWGKQMRSALGAAFLWLVCFIYFTQGFRSFVWTAVSYQLKDMLKLSPSASQFVVSVAFFPWSIKPLYGILSDCIPIKGKKRVPYLVIATSLSLFPWLVLGSVTSLRSSQLYLTILLTVQNLGSAMADVVIDAMIAEAVQFDPAAFGSDLQSLSWFSMALGGICGSLFGGYTLSNLKIETIFLLFSIFPSIQLLSCGFVEEIPTRGKRTSTMPEDKDEDEAQMEELSKFSYGNNDVDSQNNLSSTSYTNGKVSLGEPPKSDSAVRRRKTSKKNAKQESQSRKSNVMEQSQRSLFIRSFLTLKSAFYSLCDAFRQPVILRPMAWFFCSHVTVPNLSSVMFYYQSEVLHLEASFLGSARVVGWFGLMIGTFTYNRYLKHMRLRRILLWTHIGLAILTALDIVLVSRKNIQFGIPDKHMVLFGSALTDAVNQFKMMPFLIISGQLCPLGIEGTLFALFMSIHNFGSTVSSFLGAALASLLNISSNSFDNLLLGVLLQTILAFVPTFFLFLIPKEATGLSA